MHPVIAELLVTARQQDVQRSVRAASRSHVSNSDSAARRHHSLRRRTGQH